MATRRYTGLEDQVTINIFLPSNNTAERFAISKIITRLKRRYMGLTYSRSAQPVFVGYWRKPLRGGKYQWIRDEIAWVFIDTTADVDDISFRDSLARLKQMIKDEYKNVYKPQKEVWIIVREGYRVIE